jgi:UDP-3-O-[3-hydroxymyristoyl] glucosamine N-acyltransferase
MIRASDIAIFLNKELIGKDVSIHSIGSINQLEPNSLIFAKKYTFELTEALNGVEELLVLAAQDYAGHLTTTHILCDNPRQVFSQVLQHFFNPVYIPSIASTAIIAPSAKIGKDVSIGHYTIIGENVEIGDFSIISHHVVIHDNCIVGKHCVIKPSTVIGDIGFGLEFEDGIPTRIPHLGHVVIGNYVEVGALNAIARGTIENTVLGDHVKLDDHVFIAHNVHIGDNSVIIAGAEISGSVQIGKNVWVAPQASIINQVTIGDDALIGIGAVVTKSVESNMIVAGNPAKPLRRRFPDKA